MMQQTLPSIVGHLARFLGAGDPAAERAAALACHATQAGHVCADLAIDAGWGPWLADLDETQREAWRASLATLAIVGRGEDWTPLVWDGRRLYLRRYWDYECRVAADLRGRAEAWIGTDTAIDQALDSAFSDVGQRTAARMALSRRLALISGGPGTGKTTTLARLIGLMNMQARLAGTAPPRIALAAPTGKAAARMADALGAAGEGLPAMTLHRLLGMRAAGDGFRHHRDRPLALEVLVVDEASMIDLSLMAHLLEALPPTARLVLLGDRDQLAAVEAGAVFADLCASRCLADCVAALTTSYRFCAESGIGRLAALLREGDAPAVVDLLHAGHAGVAWQAGGQRRALITAVQAGYADYRHAVTAGLPPEELFARFERFRVLCAHRQDADAINRALAGGDAGQAFPGLPVMVVRNDPLLRLFNGDVGLVLADPATGNLQAWFPGTGSAGALPRRVPLVRLPDWVPAWAMTVHKSQGSEFDEVLFVLPEADSPVMTRELVYTGVTRARRQITLWAGESVLRTALGRRAERMSGLREKLAD